MCDRQLAFDPAATTVGAPRSECLFGGLLLSSFFWVWESDRSTWRKLVFRVVLNFDATEKEGGRRFPQERPLSKVFSSITVMVLELSSTPMIVGMQVVFFDLSVLCCCPHLRVLFC